MALASPKLIRTVQRRRTTTPPLGLGCSGLLASTRRSRKAALIVAAARSGGEPRSAPGPSHPPRPNAKRVVFANVHQRPASNVPPSVTTSSMEDEEEHSTQRITLLIGLSFTLMTVPWVKTHPVALLGPALIFAVPATNNALRPVLREGLEMLSSTFRWFWRHRRDSDATAPHLSMPPQQMHSGPHLGHLHPQQQAPPPPPQQHGGPVPWNSSGLHQGVPLQQGGHPGGPVQHWTGSAPMPHMRPPHRPPMQPMQPMPPRSPQAGLQPHPQQAPHYDLVTPDLDFDIASAPPRPRVAPVPLPPGHQAAQLPHVIQQPIAGSECTIHTWTDPYECSIQAERADSALHRQPPAPHQQVYQQASFPRPNSHPRQQGSGPVAPVVPNIGHVGGSQVPR